MTSSFWIGIAVGVLLTIPLIVLATRRTARRVRHLEQRARAAERLAELGTLTGGLAHEIKNPLSSINLNVQLIEEDLRDLTRDGGVAATAAESQGNRPVIAGPAGSATSRPTTPAVATNEDRLGRIRRRFESLTRETRRLRDILDDFLRFAGRMKLDLTPIDLNLLVSEVVDFFQPQAQAAGATLRTQLADGPATAPADAGLLKQALLNLMINACQAMQNARQAGTATGGGGDLLVRIQRYALDAEANVEIHVIDTGPGIPPADLPKIFQPYFSTKRGGTGLGLPTARRIIEEHGGTLTVHTEVGKGTDFTVTLPTRPAAG